VNHQWRRWILWGAVGVAYVWLLSTRLYAVPLLADEPVTASTAEMPFGSQQPLGGHPPLYMQCLTFMTHVLGLHAESLRWLGVLCFFTAAGLLWQVSQRWAVGSGRWVCALYLTNPLAIHGALTTCIDNTVVMLMTVIVIWWLSRRTLPLRGRAILTLGVLWYIWLWAKFSTPLLLPPLLWFVYVIRGQALRGLRDVGLVCIVGGTLFLIAWGWYSHLTGMPFWWFITGRIGGIVTSGHLHPTLSALQEVAHRLARVTLSITPYTVLLWLYASWQSGKQWSQNRRQAGAEVLTLLFSWGVFLGYLSIAGMVAGFPKYQVPLVPLMALLSGVTFQRLLRDVRLPCGLLIAVLGGAALFTWGVVGDLQYLLTQSVRHAMIFTPTHISRAMRELGLHLGWLALLSALIGSVILLWDRSTLRISRRLLVATTLTLTTLGSQMGTAAMQVTAPYATHYMYGRSLATYRASIQFLTKFHQEHPTAYLLVPWDTYYHAVGLTLYPVQPGERIVLWDAHDTPEALIEKLRQVDCVMVDPDYNFSHTLRNVLPDPRVQAVLTREFERHEIGQVTAWTRRTGPARDAETPP